MSDVLAGTYYDPPPEIEAPLPTEEAASTKIDINDLSLADEELLIDTAGDAFAFPPPPPERGNPYVLRLKRGADGWTRGVTNKDDPAKIHRPYMMCQIEAGIVSEDPRLSSKRIPDIASTMVMDSSGTCRVAGILLELGQTVNPRTSMLELARALDAVLAGEPQVRGFLQWEAYCNPKQGGCKKRIRGESRFPAIMRDGKPTGEHSPDMPCPGCGNALSARAVVQRYKRL